MLQPDTESQLVSRGFAMLTRQPALLRRGLTQALGAQQAYSESRLKLSPQFTAKRDAALTVIQAKGIKGAATSPIFKLLWKLGIEARPPHYQSFITTATIFAVSWFIGMSLLVLLHLLPTNGKSATLIFSVLAFASAFFGLSLAYLVTRKRTRYKLPKWESL